MTTKLTIAEVPQFPCESAALASTLWTPSETFRESQAAVQGDDPSQPTSTLSTNHLTSVTPLLAEATAPRLTVPSTIAPGEIPVSDKVGTLPAADDGTSRQLMTIMAAKKRVAGVLSMSRTPAFQECSRRCATV